MNSRAMINTYTKGIAEEPGIGYWPYNMMYLCDIYNLLIPIATHPIAR